jgi:hypothetical protein
VVQVVPINACIVKTKNNGLLIAFRIADPLEKSRYDPETAMVERWGSRRIIVFQAFFY